VTPGLLEHPDPLRYLLARYAEEDACGRCGTTNEAEDCDGCAMSGPDGDDDASA
jgi:hypothetical protein